MKTVPLILAALLVSTPARAAPALPYAARGRAYDAASTTVRGDVRNIGMAGANIGLADSFMAMHDNPAGLAMAMPAGGLVFFLNTTADEALQSFSRPVNTFHIGAFSPEYPWGWGVTFSHPFAEGRDYFLPATGETAKVAVGIRELRLSVARLFFEHRLSLGATVVLAEAFRSLEFESSSSTGLRNPSLNFLTYSAGVTLGAQYQFPHRLLLGLSVSSPLVFPGDDKLNIVDLPGFDQEVWVPWEIAAGFGWIPNRFFQLGLSAKLIGVTPRASRLADQNVAVGQRLTLQPRLGFSYRAVEYPDLVLETTAGTYLEFSRTEGRGVRPHVTLGIEIKPWIFGVGTAVDYAAGYTNFLISVGLDVGRMLQKMELVPKTWSPPPVGVFPEPFREHDEGLTRPINPAWKKIQAAPNVFKIVDQLPERVEDKIDDIQENGLKGVIDTKIRMGRPPPPSQKGRPSH